MNEKQEWANRERLRGELSRWLHVRAVYGPTYSLEAKITRLQYDLRIAEARLLAVQVL